NGDRTVLVHSRIDLGAVVVFLEPEDFDPVTVTELQRPCDEANVPGRGVDASAGRLLQQAQLFPEGLRADAMPRATINQANEGDPFVLERLLDEEVRRVVRIHIPHEGDDRDHSRVGGIVDRVHQAQRGPLPGRERLQAYKVWPGRTGKLDRVDR